MTYEALLFLALASPHGVKVSTNDPVTLRAQLYKLRRADMTTFESLSFVISPVNPEDELWLVRTKARADAED